MNGNRRGTRKQNRWFHAKKLLMTRIASNKMRLSVSYLRYPLYLALEKHVRF